MLPIIAIMGRPNVGKSTLFNRLTKSQQALVADQPGVTRDRLYGEANFNGRQVIIIDTGGLEGEDTGMAALVERQAWAAASEADLILWVVDARAGLTAADELLGEHLRRLNKPVLLVVNKTDGLNSDIAISDFFHLGFGQPFPIAAAHGAGVLVLQQACLERLPPSAPEVEAPELGADRIKLAIVGRPNVGKSTLVNRLLGEERVLVYDQPGTTRDSIFIPFERHGTLYTLIDTAGVRRRRGIRELVEKFSVIKTLQAIAMADVVVMVVDAHENITDQDLHLLGFVLEAGRALVIAVNKWDGLPPSERDYVKKELDRRLDFVDFAKIYFISALHGTGVGEIFSAITQAYESATRKFSTPELTRLLEDIVASHQPPAVHGRHIKLRYAHAGGSQPPLIVIHGKQTDHLPVSYRRYLMNSFRKALKLVGTPVKIVLKNDDNPYEGRSNAPTLRQQKKRRRLMQHVKKKKK